MWDGINKRRFPRAKFPCQIKVVARTPHFTASTYTENISVGGICVNLEQNLGRFTPAELMLYLPDEKPPIKCKCKTIWVIEKHSSHSAQVAFDTGIEFEDISDSDKQRIDDLILKILRAEESARQNSDA